MTPTSRGPSETAETVAQRSKTHHFLPQFILRGFAREGQIATVELRGRSYLQTIAKAAAENNYNTIELDDGSQSDMAERLIANEIEGPAAATLERIADGAWLRDASERAVVARFLALQYLRVPWRRAQYDAMADQLMKLEIAAGGPSRLREVLEEQEGRPVADEEVAETWQALRDFDDWRLSLPREHHVIESLKMAEEFAPGLAATYDWAVMQWTRKTILTCDSPVMLLPHRAAQPWQGVGLFTAGSIWFPVDRRTALVLVHRSEQSELDGARLPPTAASAKRLNRYLASNSYKRLYHHPDDTLVGLLGADFELPSPPDPGFDDDHSIKLRDVLRSMGEWHFEHPEQPHPFSGRGPAADSGVSPWEDPTRHSADGE